MEYSHKWNGEIIYGVTALVLVTRILLVGWKQKQKKRVWQQTDSMTTKTVKITLPTASHCWHGDAICSTSQVFIEWLITLCQTLLLTLCTQWGERQIKQSHFSVREFNSVREDTAIDTSKKIRIKRWHTCSLPGIVFLLAALLRKLLLTLPKNL